MGGKALLIASPVGTLEGPKPDVERVAGILEPRGFDIRRCGVDEPATRDLILTQYRSLIEDATSGDPVLIYYSGHGAHSLDEVAGPEGQAPKKRYNHFIVPTDLLESSDTDFRGILSIELSSLLAQLTARTNNVTVIFDCCHSGGMSRGAGLQPRGLEKKWFTGSATHLDKIRNGTVPGFPLAGVNDTGNPDAVRLMATLPSQKAWEWGDGAGNSYGLLTEALVTAFEEAEDRPVTWSTISRRVREIVQLKEPGQTPRIEGPGNRYVFDTAEADLTGTIPVRSSDDGPMLEGGRLQGVHQGNEYVVMPSGHEKLDRDQALATATVTHVGGSWALVRLDPDTAEVPAGALAFPLRQAHARRPVAVQAGAGLSSKFETALAESGLVRQATEDESKKPEEVLAVVEERNGELHVWEQPGLDVINPVAASEDSVEEVVTNLGHLARARQLETLAHGTGPSALNAEYEVEWGRVAAGKPVVLPNEGEVIYEGEKVFVRVRNKSPKNLYVSVLNIGLDGEITLVTSGLTHDGEEIAPNGPPFVLGEDRTGTLKGLGPLRWPKVVPRDGQPRPESLVVVISDSPQNLTALKAKGMAGKPKGDAVGESPLQQMVSQMTTGQTRNFAEVDTVADVGYAVEHIRFFADSDKMAVLDVADSAASEGRAATRSAPTAVGVPINAVQDTVGFLMDDRPAESAAYRRPRGAAPPDAVSVQLGEIVVHSNKALLSTDIRVDAMVVTGGDNPEACYRAGTVRFPGIKDGDRLPLDNLLVFQGPVKGFVDLQVWVSRDDKNSLDLAELIKDETNSKEFKGAALALAGLAVAAPPAAAIVAGLSGATVVANSAYKILSAAVGKSVGLYRTSLLANQRYGVGEDGVGRTPANGMMRAQDFSFWYNVSEFEVEPTVARDGMVELDIQLVAEETAAPAAPPQPADPSTLTDPSAPTDPPVQP